jgi:heat-inducible transcriptional repressor
LILSNREKEVLRLVIESFTEEAEPVGSRFLAKRYALPYSPATIRNVMMDLEDRGLLQQPHTSAGRVPTDAAYRYYLDQIMEAPVLSAEEREAIERALDLSGHELHRVLEETSRVLGWVSHQLGLAVAPSVDTGVLADLRFIEGGESRAMLVVRITSGLVRSILLEFPCTLSAKELSRAGVVLRERLVGLTLREARASIGRRLQADGQPIGVVEQEVVRCAPRIFEFGAPGELHWGGTAEIVSQPEFREPARIRGLIELLERREPIADSLLSGGRAGAVEVSIGQENTREEMSSYSLVRFAYKTRDGMGAIGVLGPTRMKYWKLVSAVEYIGRRLERVL